MNKLSALHTTITLTATEIVLNVHNYFMENQTELMKQHLKTVILGLIADYSSAQTSYLTEYHSLLLQLRLHFPERYALEPLDLD